MAVGFDAVPEGLFFFVIVSWFGGVWVGVEGLVLRDSGGEEGVVGRQEVEEAVTVAESREEEFQMAHLII